jgi:hypothetical protein
LQATTQKTAQAVKGTTAGARRSGAQSIFTAALFTAICDRISRGESLRSVCRDPEMPHKSTVLRWLHEMPDLRDQYVRARDDLMEYWASDILEIADDGTLDTIPGLNKYGDEVMVPNHANVQRDRLRIDSRKWLLSKLAARTYGDRLDVEVSGEVQHRVDITALSAREKMRRLALFMLEDQAAGTVIEGTVDTSDDTPASD